MRTTKRSVITENYRKPSLEVAPTTFAQHLCDVVMSVFIGKIHFGRSLISFTRGRQQCVHIHSCGLRSPLLLHAVPRMAVNFDL